MKFRLAVLAGLMASGLMAQAAPDWGGVRRVLGRDGELEDGVLRFTYERSDLQVKKDGVAISPGLVFESWYGFWPLDAGMTVLMGDTCMTEEEVPAVLAEAHRQGVKLTALHNHLIGETPRIYFAHIEANGRPEELAEKVKALIARTATPTEEVKPDAAGSPERWNAITAVLGKPAEVEGDVAEYGYWLVKPLAIMGKELPSTEALETAPEVKFQLLADGRAITYGEVMLTSDEVGPVFHVLAEHGIAVNALHNHMLEEEPRLFFLHWWKVGAPGDLARGVQAAMARLEVRPAGK